MTVTDWRDAPADVVAPLLAAERRRWSQHLWWDLGPSLAVVERARASGELPGLIVFGSDGQPSGWTFYLLSHGLLQIGALNASTASALRLLLDRIFVSPEAHISQGLSCFLFPMSDSVGSALTRQHFALESQRYLVRPLREAAPLPDTQAPLDLLSLRPFAADDAAAAVRLLARAYAGEPSARCFAPHARLDEWAHYFGQLLSGPGCGGLVPEATLVAVANDGALRGLIVTTLVAPGTAHIAQVVVDHTARRTGLAAALVQAAGTAARGLGARRLTLLVSESNAPARALYERLGFSEVSRFLYGQRGPAPRRRPEARGQLTASASLS
jgi:ribosomal protein S18 acetylase RimI-like enzyme